MELLFLGTGAADWSIKHRNEGDFFRRNSSALADLSLLIDPGPHIFDFAEKNGTPEMFDNVSDVIVTHSHGDHFRAKTIKKLCAHHPITLYCTYPVCRKMYENSGDIMNLNIVLLNPFEEVTTTSGYEIIPCTSNHATEFIDEQTLNYIVKKDGRSFFYGLDSGWIMFNTWRRIKKERPNAIIFECTMGYCPGDDRMFGHTGIPMLKIMLETMRAQHGPADDAKYYTSHMARTLHGSHEELTEQLLTLDVTPAYDGMKIEI